LITIIVCASPQIVRGTSLRLTKDRILGGCDVVSSRLKIIIKIVAGSAGKNQKPENT
jgi:hypothetical protein